MKKFYFVVLMFIICFGLSIDSLVITIICLIGGGYGIYNLWTNSTEAEIREFTFANWFQKKTGIDIFSEE